VEIGSMGVGAGHYMYDVVVESSRSLSHLLVSSCHSIYGATWRIRLNHPCAAAMRPYVKLL